MPMLARGLFEFNNIEFSQILKMEEFIPLEKCVFLRLPTIYTGSMYKMRTKRFWIYI